MKVSVVIPHYNSPDTLRALLGQLRTDSFDAIVVLDDCSQDQLALGAIAATFPEATIHRGAHNVGAGANRNRALECVNEGVVWFVDADMELPAQDNARRLRELHAVHSNSMIGGLVLNKEGQQMGWNYGHEMHPVHDAVFATLTSFLSDERAWAQLTERGWDYAWLRPEEKTPQRRQVDWVSEANFSLDSSLFRAVGGCDRAFRYHEGQDLAHRIRATGAQVWFDPSVVTHHLEVDVRGARRNDEFEHAQQLFYEKHYGVDPKVQMWLKE